MQSSFWKCGVAVSATCFVVILFVGGVSAQVTPPLPIKPQFTSTTNLIEVPVVVRAKDGRPVTGLSRDDFTVLDNGRTQRLVGFELFESAGKESIRDSKTGVHEPSESVSPRRYFLIVVPRLDFGSRYRAIKALEKAAEMGVFGRPDDFFALADNSGLTQPFTNDLSKIRVVLSRMGKQSLSPCWDGDWFPRSRQLLIGIQNVEGRKFVVVFSDGASNDFCFRPASNSPSLLISDALAANAGIYPVDARGVVPIIPFGDASIQSEVWPGTSTGGSIMGDLSARSSQLAWQNMDLIAAAESTGGRALPPNNDLASVFRLTDEDSTYYKLSYYLPDLQSDGRFHTVQVSVNSKKAKLLHKPGYFAPLPYYELSRSGKREWLYEALVSGRPLNDIFFSATSYTFPNDERKCTVAISLELRWWVPRELPKPKRQWVTVVGVITSTGVPVSSFTKETSWTVENPQYEGDYALRSARYNFILPLPRGQYEFRFGATDLDANIVGTSSFRVEVAPAKQTQQPYSGPLVVADKLIPIAVDEQSATDENTSFDPFILSGARLIPVPVPISESTAEIYLFTRLYNVNESDLNKCSLRLKNTQSGSVIGPLACTVSEKRVDPRFGYAILFRIDPQNLNLSEGLYKAELSIHSSDHSPTTAVFRIVKDRK